MQDYRITLGLLLVPLFTGRSPDAIDRTSVRAYQAAKLRQGLAPKTVANHVRLLHGIVRHAVNRDWVTRNPVAGIEHPLIGPESCSDQGPRGESATATPTP